MAADFFLLEQLGPSGHIRTRRCHREAERPRNLVAAELLMQDPNPLDPEGELRDAVFPADLTLNWYRESPVDTGT